MRNIGLKKSRGHLGRKENRMVICIRLSTSMSIKIHCQGKKDTNIQETIGKIGKKRIGVT